ncbi:hypothetical protein ASD00_23985 [Ensifer sp. Root31]|nr:hypothetical protein ASD00_23985 [Ensifer sp. Root31]
MPIATDLKGWFDGDDEKRIGRLSTGSRILTSSAFFSSKASEPHNDARGRCIDVPQYCAR